MKYNPPVGATDPDLSYLNADPAHDGEGSPVPAAAIEFPMREIVAVIKAAGLTPSNADLTQLLQAIQKLATGDYVKKTGDTMKGSLVVDGGTISVRTVGAPAQGTYFFGDQSGGARYIGYNATAYQLPTASLYVGGDVFSKNIRLARIDEIPVVPPSVGNNQTWQDVTASRAAGTTYYNTTGKPIQLSIDRSSGGANASAHTLTIGGVGASSIPVSATQIYTNLNHIVPPGASYSLAITGSASILKWAELR